MATIDGQEKVLACKDHVINQVNNPLSTVLNSIDFMDE